MALTESATAAAAVAFFRDRFRELGDPARAKAEKAYLKSRLRFHGVTMPQVRAASVEYAKEHPALTGKDLRAIVAALFATDHHDLRSAGIGLLEQRRDLLRPADRIWLVDLVRLSPNWAHVDWLATKVIGPVIAGDDRSARWIRRWAVDDELWVRRTALLAQHDELRAGRGDFALFAEIAAPMLPEREFWIRKAIGWVLREVSKERPQLTYDFLLPNRERASGLTLREGAKYLSPAMRRRLGLE